MKEEIKEKAHKVMELGKHLKNLHHKKGFGGLLFIDLSMVKFSRLTRYIRLLEEENKSLQSQLKVKEEVIEEAISYIRDCCNMDSKWVNLHFEYAQKEMSSDEVNDLLEILSKGENK